MSQEQLMSALQEIEKRLEILKQENLAEYERILKELESALGEFDNDLKKIT